MHIHGTTHVHGPHGTGGPHFSQRPQSNTNAAPTSGVDRVEISAAAQAAIQAVESGEIRESLVRDIRAQIAAGTYDTPEKFEAAFEKMLDELV